MLDNDPPPGTRVRFLRETRTARRNDIGTLRRPVRRYLRESADDDFEVEFNGEIITVQRQDIERVR